MRSFELAAGVVAVLWTTSAWAQSAPPSAAATAPATASPAATGDTTTAAGDTPAPTGAAASTVTTPAPGDAPTAVPATTTRLRWNRTTIEAGAAIFATTYIASSLAAADGYDTRDGTSNPRRWLWYPGIGPFILLKDKNTALADVFLVLDGLAQLGGIGALVYGIGSPTPLPADSAPKAAKIDVAPLVGGGVAGAAVMGSF